MADIFSPEKRSWIMGRIKGKDTKPELIVRSIVHRMGFRFRLHRRDLPGAPDLVFPKYKKVIFIHGCFWHGHKCHLFKKPSTNINFWRMKITSNKKNDRQVIKQLLGDGWRVLVVWECCLKGKGKLPLKNTIDKVEKWLLSDKIFMELRGRNI